MNKPAWLKQQLPSQKVYDEMREILAHFNLHTVCESAHCPNTGTCFGDKTATFMIMGSTCTRNCKFCAVTGGDPEQLDPKEPERVALAGKELGLKHFVVTSVTRDDLADGGAGHFAKTIEMIRQHNPKSTVEVLIPDFEGKDFDIMKIIAARPDIINHNMETVKELYHEVRPMAIYDRSLELLKLVKEKSEGILTKSGIMVGLGERPDQVEKLMEDLRRVDCDILTIGQYLRPSEEHLPIREYIHPDQFKAYELLGKDKGFGYVASGPFVRSSFHAAEGLESVREESENDR